MDENEVWKVYEVRKREIGDVTPSEYEAAVKDLAEELEL